MRRKKSKPSDGCSCVQLLWGLLNTGFTESEILYSYSFTLNWRARVVNPRSLPRQDSKQKDETKYILFSLLVAPPSRKGSSISSWALVTIANSFQPFSSIFSDLNSFNSNSPSPNFSTCSLIPIKSIKCPQAFSIELCLSMSNRTWPLCCSNADPCSSSR